MGEWTNEKWVAAAVVWLWGTFLSGKLSGVLDGFFEAKVLAIYPYYKISQRHGGIPAWLVGMACVWLAMPSDKHFMHYGTDWVNAVIISCFFSLFLIGFLTYLGWLLSNYFRMAGTVADASALRWKSMKPYEHD